MLDEVKPLDVNVSVSAMIGCDYVLILMWNNILLSYLCECILSVSKAVLKTNFVFLLYLSIYLIHFPSGSNVIVSLDWSPHSFILLPKYIQLGLCSIKQHVHLYYTVAHQVEIILASDTILTLFIPM